MLQESLTFLRTVLLSRMHKYLLERLLHDANFQLSGVWFKRLTLLQEKCHLPILHSIAMSKDGRKLASIREQYYDPRPLEEEGLVQRFEESLKITPEGEKFICDLSHLLECESRLSIIYI